MAAIDAAIVLAFAAYALAAGFRARREASRGLEDYFLAGRSLSGVSAGLSMAATQFAADTPLLVTGLIATAGVFALWRLWIYALAFLLLGFLLAPAWRRARVLTDAELAELRYGGAAARVLRVLKALYFGTLFNCVVLAMVLFAVKEVAQPFLPWHLWLPEGLFSMVESLVAAVGVPFARQGTPDAIVWQASASNLLSVLALVGVTVVYSSSGGLRGVVRTDQVQLLLMLLATAGYAWWIAAELGGLGAVAEGVRRAYAEPGMGLSGDQLLAFTPGAARDAALPVLAVLGLQWLVQMNADGTGYLAQRSMACRSDADARVASVVFTVAQVVLRSLFWLPIGVGLLLLFPVSPGEHLQAGFAAAREATFVRGMEALPPGLLGLMLAAMLAALASTVDSHLNWGASFWTHDLYDRVWCRGVRGEPASPRRLVWVARLSNVGLLAIALGLMTQLDSIQEAWQASLLLGAGMGVMLVLRWLWWRITARGELASLAASAALAPLLLTWLPGAEQEAERLLWMALGSTLAGVAASLALGPEDDARLDIFYRRVRPPGFWGPVARRAGDAPEQLVAGLGIGVGAVVTTALASFCVLVGLGTWLVGGTPPPWLPHRGAWIALLLVAAGLFAWLALQAARRGRTSRAASSNASSTP